MTISLRKLSSLVIFRPLLSLSPLRELTALLSAPEDDLDLVSVRYAELALAILGAGGNLSEILFAEILREENLYTDYLFKRKTDTALIAPLLRRELDILSLAADFDGWEYRRLLSDPTLAVWHHGSEDFYAKYAEHIERLSSAN